MKYSRPVKKVYKPSTVFSESKLHKNSSSDETNNNRKVTITIATKKGERNTNEQLIQYMKNIIWIYHCILLKVSVVYWLLTFDLFPNLVHPWEHRTYVIYWNERICVSPMKYSRPVKKVYKPSTVFSESKLHKNSSSDETNNNRKVTITIATKKGERNTNEQLIQYMKNIIWIYHCILLKVSVVYWLLTFDLFPNLVHPWEHRMFMNVFRWLQPWRIHVISCKMF